jgi:hypothetical protein
MVNTFVVSAKYNYIRIVVDSFAVSAEYINNIRCVSASYGIMTFRLFQIMVSYQSLCL